MAGKYFIYFIVTIMLFFISCEKRTFAVQKSEPIKRQDLETELYKKAQLDLDKRFYQSYRIAERLSRANKLDNYSWRVIIPLNNEDYEINAATSNSNAIILKTGLIDSFSGEISVLAFVIAHEMAHQVNKDQAASQRNKEQLERKLEEKIVILADDSDSVKKKAISVGYDLIYKDKIEELKTDIENLKADFYAEERRHEYEADKTALIFMAKAGFNPKDSMRFFEFIKREPISTDQELSTHPKPVNRILQIDHWLKSANISELKKEGQKYIAGSKPLNYEKFYDKQVLGKPKYIIAIVINSKYGSHENVNKPFEELFGK